MSAFGSRTFRTYRVGLTMSVPGGRPEVVCRRSKWRETLQRTSQHVTYLIGKPRAWISYFNPITIESGPTSGSTRVFENPTSRIQA
ncbi:hypothetical protein SAMN05443248_1202 [Bradyrhizobium erythrophlei]|uniref:Uncharacterized protein n=1 Tax=Bradyrhizobium erythrophlei TaxID=1437360 RepID=A0A1M5J119_9BRAD|nr:hypothetical protein SAMN05443248_1202 [Bradyrhizobium erythrophlei]